MFPTQGRPVQFPRKVFAEHRKEAQLQQLQRNAKPGPCHGLRLSSSNCSSCPATVKPQSLESLKPMPAPSAVGTTPKRMPVCQGDFSFPARDCTHPEGSWWNKTPSQQCDRNLSWSCGGGYWNLKAAIVGTTHRPQPPHT